MGTKGTVGASGSTRSKQLVEKLATQQTGMSAFEAGEIEKEILNPHSGINKSYIVDIKNDGKGCLQASGGECTKRRS